MDLEKGGFASWIWHIESLGLFGCQYHDKENNCASPDFGYRIETLFSTWISIDHRILNPPPLALTAEPVIHLASWLHKRSMTSATSSGGPNLSMLCVGKNSALDASAISEPQFMTASVSVRLTMTEFAVVSAMKSY